jgi:hypothetical protein
VFSRTEGSSWSGSASSGSIGSSDNRHERCRWEEEKKLNIIEIVLFFLSFSYHSIDDVDGFAQPCGLEPDTAIALEKIVESERIVEIRALDPLCILGNLFGVHKQRCFGCLCVVSHFPSETR